MSNQETSLTLTKESALTNVTVKIQTLQKETGITLPKGYSASNAINSAWLKLQEVKDKNGKFALEVCSKNSIIDCLYSMVLQGLSPAKDQCYFIVFGNQLQLMKSYLGNIAATKRLKGIKDVFANCIYQGDEFDYKIDLDTGVKKIIKHNQKFQNIDTDKILGAYAVIVREDAPNYVEVMTIKQIRNSWAMGATKGNSKAHQNFTDEMCQKTVINRACKHFTKTSDDSDALVEAINKTYEYDEKDIVESTHEEVKQEIHENANKEVIDIPVEEVKAEEVKTETNGSAKQVQMGDEPF